MPKNKKSTAVLIIVALMVWAVAVYRIKTGGPATNTEAEKKDQSAIKDPRAGIANDSALFNPLGRDMFTPVEKRVVQAKGPEKKDEKIKPEAKIVLPDWRLDGMLWNDKAPVAILRLGTSERTEMVKAGATLDDITVLRIEKNQVHVRYKDKDFIIE